MILSCRIDTALRLLKRTPQEAMDRRDAAHSARVERAYCRAHGIDEDRNRRARNKAREYIQGLRFWRTGQV